MERSHRMPDDQTHNYAPAATIGTGAVAGPSKVRLDSIPEIPQTREIPSYGLEYFEYRRRLFLAGIPIPEPPYPLPPTYTVPAQYPDPVPTLPRHIAPNSAIGRLEQLLEADGAEETQMAWRGGVAGVHDHLSNKRRLSVPIRLGLVIKILRAGWIRDGTWPIDPKTKRATRPPDDSPIPSATEIQPQTQDTSKGYLSPEQRAQATKLDEEDWVEEEMLGERDLRVGSNVWRGGADNFIRPVKPTH